MRTIVQMSHLLIGARPSDQLDQLAASIARLQPEVIAVCGNVSATGHERELRQAKEFLEQLPSAQVVVPGDRDLSPHALSRLFAPSSSFWTHVESATTPCYSDNECIVVGVNSTSRLGQAWELASETSAVIEELFQFAEPTARRILVSYRPVLHRGNLETPLGRPLRFDYELVAVQAKTSATESFTLPAPAQDHGFAFHCLRLQAEELVVERHAWVPEIGDYRLMESTARVIAAKGAEAQP